MRQAKAEVSLDDNDTTLASENAFKDMDGIDRNSKEISDPKPISHIPREETKSSPALNKEEAKQHVDEEENIVEKDLSNYSEVMNLLRDYNIKFIREWCRTYNFHKWKLEHHPSCAFLPAGTISKSTVEFYKEIVSKSSNFIGSSSIKLLDLL